jgi:hypothetical protein
MLKQRESVRLDADRIEALYLQLGETSAEDVVCRALEELALRLGHAERYYRSARLDDMRKSSRSLIAISEQIGMPLLARVAEDVTLCIDTGDGNALAATFTRLLRIAECSLCEIWEMQDRTL